METEIKLAVPSASEAVDRLTHAGFNVHVERAFESNLVLDDDEGTLRNSRRLLRLRRVASKVICTFKGPELEGRHKQREEREFEASSFEESLAVFAGLGFSPRFRYEKYRTEYARAGETGIATVDETPIGCFIELEGDGEWIDATAKELGFQETEYITASYAKVYSAWCSAHGKVRGDFVF